MSSDVRINISSSFKLPSRTNFLVLILEISAEFAGAVRWVGVEILAVDLFSPEKGNSHPLKPFVWWPRRVHS